MVHYVTVELSGFPKERRRSVLGWWDGGTRYLPGRHWTAAPGCASQPLHPAEKSRETEGQIGVAGTCQLPEQCVIAVCAAAGSPCGGLRRQSAQRSRVPRCLCAPKAPRAPQGSGRARRWCFGASGQALGKLSQAANGAGPHASGSQEPQDGLTDSLRGLEGVRAGVEVGRPSHKRLVNVKDQRLGLG